MINKTEIAEKLNGMMSEAWALISELSSDDMATNAAFRVKTSQLIRIMSQVVTDLDSANEIVQSVGQ